jgi:outer membrane assembly lipoprotein yfiO
VNFYARLSAATLAAALAAALAGCASKSGNNMENWSPGRIHSEAKEEMSAGSYDKAIPMLETLEGRAAGTPLAQQAQLEKAYAQFKNGDKAEAVGTLDRFIRLHPASPALDYALYMKGVIHFNDDMGLFASIARQDLSERDQKAAKEAYESFSELVTRFPDSRYAPDARARMRYTVNALAQYEVHVARYYYRRAAYVAAINRAQQALKDYRDAPALEEALHILADSYDKLGMTDLRDDARRVLELNYPGGSVKTKSKPWWQIW